MLAALSHWLATQPNAHRNENEIPASYRAFFQDCPPLMPSEINELCERINFEPEDQQPLDAMTNCMGIMHALGHPNDFDDRDDTMKPELIEEIEAAAMALARIENETENFWEHQSTNWDTVCATLAGFVRDYAGSHHKTDYQKNIREMLR